MIPAYLSNPDYWVTVALVAIAAAIIILITREPKGPRPA